MKRTELYEMHKVGDRRTIVTRYKKGRRVRVGDDKYITFHAATLVPITQEYDRNGDWDDVVIDLDRAIAAPTVWQRFRDWLRYKVLRLPPIPRAYTVSSTTQEVPMKK